MKLFSWNQDISSKNDYPNSLDNRLISSSINFIKEKTPKKNNFKKSRNLLKDKYKTIDFNHLVKYVHQYFLSFYRNDEEDYVSVDCCGPDVGMRQQQGGGRSGRGRRVAGRFGCDGKNGKEGGEACQTGTETAVGGGCRGAVAQLLCRGEQDGCR